MRRIAKPGEVLELDFGYLGITFDPDSLRNRKTYLFSARFRFSRRTYREAVFDQTGRTFFLSHVHAFETDVDPELLGGALVRIGDRVIDRSTRTLLRAIAERLQHTSV